MNTSTVSQSTSEAESNSSTKLEAEESLALSLNDEMEEELKEMEAEAGLVPEFKVILSSTDGRSYKIEFENAGVVPAYPVQLERACQRIVRELKQVLRAQAAGK